MHAEEEEIYACLSNRRKNKGKEYLPITGAGHVGKTFAVRAFGEAEFESFLEINFQNIQACGMSVKDTAESRCVAGLMRRYQALTVLKSAK